VYQVATTVGPAQKTRSEAAPGWINKLGLDTVAEGIELEPQVAALLALGCVAGQGFLFATSGSLEQLSKSEFVARRNALWTAQAAREDLSPTGAASGRSRTPPGKPRSRRRSTFRSGWLAISPAAGESVFALVVVFTVMRSV
jgi:hypothetical protein